MGIEYHLSHLALQPKTFILWELLKCAKDSCPVQVCSKGTLRPLPSPPWKPHPREGLMRGELVGIILSELHWTNTDKTKSASFLHRKTVGMSKKYLKEVVVMWQVGWGCQAPSSEDFLGHFSLLVASALLLGATSPGNHHPRVSSASSSAGMKLILLILNIPDSKPKVNPHLLPKEKAASTPA